MSKAASPPPLVGGGRGEGSKNQASREYAKQMRREPTPSERLLWQKLRNCQVNGLKFRRQAPISPDIVAFFCSEAGLVVEVDGETHVDSETGAVRDAWLRSQGFRVLRFWNNEVMANPDGVVAAIQAAAEASFGSTPPPDPLPQGEGEKQR
jgi:very-short-patch-repair endonuclease